MSRPRLFWPGAALQHLDSVASRPDLEYTLYDDQIVEKEVNSDAQTLSLVHPSGTDSQDLFIS